MELESRAGAQVLEHLRARDASVRVKLNEPEVTCQVEIIPGKALIYARRVEGPGGLPAVTSGRLVALLSGGFDSSVAAYKMMRRGCHVSFAHFFGNPIAGEQFLHGRGGRPGSHPHALSIYLAPLPDSL